MARETKIIRGKEDSLVVVRDGLALMAISLRVVNEVGDHAVYARTVCRDEEETRAIFDVWKTVFRDYANTGRGLSISAVMTGKYRAYTKEIVESVAST